MRKTEHIYTHALLSEVTEYLIEDETMAVEMLSEYDALGTRPSSIHESKQSHYEAIVALTSAIEPCIEEARTESHERPVTHYRESLVTTGDPHRCGASFSCIEHPRRTK